MQDSMPRSAASASMVRKSLALVSRLKVSGPASSPLSNFATAGPRTLRTLEAAGVVEIATVESDLRRRAVWLTETGARP